MGGPRSTDLDAVLAGLRHRADEDFLALAGEREPGRHKAELPELGLRVSVTRARYPNTPTGVDLYVVTVSHLGLDRELDDGTVRGVLRSLFGAAGATAEERPTGPLIRIFRVPADAVGPAAAAGRLSAPPD